MQQPANAQEFLRGFFGTLPDNYGVLIRKITGTENVIPFAKLILPNDIHTNNYLFGLIPRRIGSSLTDYCKMIWCDTDGTLTGVDNLRVPVTVAINSGGMSRYHLYWRLSEEVDGERAEQLAQLAALSFDGDHQVASAKHTLGLPFSRNDKYTPARERTIEKWTTEIYTPEKLQEYLFANLIAPFFVDGRRHELTLALSALLARAGWKKERSINVVTLLYRWSPGIDLAGKLNDVSSTYTRIELGQTVSAAAVKTAVNKKDEYARLLIALGITARDGDIIVDGELIGKKVQIERDLTDFVMDRGDWSAVAGKLASWNNVYWEQHEEKELIAHVFGILARTKEIVQGDQVELTAKAATARAISGIVAGNLFSKVMVPPNPNELPLQNGIFNIETRELRAHEKDGRHTWVAPFSYDPVAEAPDWDAFMQEAVPDCDIRDHLQEWLGYCLMGRNPHERMLWLFGPSQTGKSTFIKTAGLLLGPAAVAISENISPYSLAMLHGMRVAMCTELPPKMLHTSIVKSLVSSDPLEARHPYGRPFTLVYEGKVLWGSNELPPLDQGEGMWRRIVPIEFRVKPKTIKNMKELSEKQAAGILNWALAGLDRLRAKRDWPLPQKVLATIREYKRASDTISVFAEEEIFAGDDEHVGVLELYQRYTAWADDRGIKIPPIGPVFYQELRKIGMEVDENFHLNGAINSKSKYFRGGRLLGGFVDAGGANRLRAVS